MIQQQDGCVRYAALSLLPQLKKAVVNFFDETCLPPQNACTSHFFQKFCLMYRQQLHSGHALARKEQQLFLDMKYRQVVEKSKHSVCGFGYISRFQLCALEHAQAWDDNERALLQATNLMTKAALCKKEDEDALRPLDADTIDAWLQQLCDKEMEETWMEQKGTESGISALDCVHPIWDAEPMYEDDTKEVGNSCLKEDVLQDNQHEDLELSAWELEVGDGWYAMQVPDLMDVTHQLIGEALEQDERLKELKDMDATTEEES